MLPAYHPPEEGEVFNTFHDMVHAAILAAGTGAASLKEIYAACVRFGRVKCRKTGGWRLVTERRNWKSHIRHTLYTTEKFLRCADDSDSWTLAPGYVHTLPQTTRHSKEGARPVAQPAPTGRNVVPPARQPVAGSVSGRNARVAADALPSARDSGRPKRARVGAPASRRASAEDDSWASDQGEGDESERPEGDAADADFADDNDPDQLGPGLCENGGEEGEQLDEDEQQEDEEEDEEVAARDEGAEAGYLTRPPGRGAAMWAPPAVGPGSTHCGRGSAGGVGGGRSVRAQALLGATAAAEASSAAAAAAAATGVVSDAAEASGLLDLSDGNTRKAWLAAQEVVNNPTAARFLLMMIHQRHHYLEAPLQAHLAQWQLLGGLLPPPFLPMPSQSFQQQAQGMLHSGYPQSRSAMPARRPGAQGRKVHGGGGVGAGAGFRVPGRFGSHPHGRYWVADEEQQDQEEPEEDLGDDASGEGEQDAGYTEEEEERGEVGVPGRRTGRYGTFERPAGPGAVVAKRGVAPPVGRRHDQQHDDPCSLEAAAVLASVAAGSATGHKGSAAARGAAHGFLAAPAKAPPRPRGAGTAPAGRQVSRELAAEAWRPGHGTVMQVEHAHDGYGEGPQRRRTGADSAGGGDGCDDDEHDDGQNGDWAGPHGRASRSAPGGYVHTQGSGMVLAQPVRNPPSGPTRRGHGQAGSGGAPAAAPPLRTRSSAPLPSVLGPGAGTGVGPAPAPAPPGRRPPSPPQPPACDAASPPLARAGSLPQGGRGSSSSVFASGADVEGVAAAAAAAVGPGAEQAPRSVRRTGAGAVLERAGSLGKRPPTDSNSSSFGAEPGDGGDELQQQQPHCLYECPWPQPPQQASHEPRLVQSEHPQPPPSKRMCQALDVARQLAAAAAASAAAGPPQGALRRTPFSAFASVAGANSGDRA